MRILAVYMTRDRSFLAQFPSNESPKNQNHKAKERRRDHINQMKTTSTLSSRKINRGQSIENIEQLAQREKGKINAHQVERHIDGNRKGVKQGS